MGNFINQLNPAGITLKDLGDGVYGSVPLSSTAQLILEFDPSRTYTDTSIAHLSHYKIYLGDSPNNPNQTIDSRDLPHPAGTRHVITDLQSKNYYVSVSTVDLYGNESSRSSEVMMTAQIPVEADLTGATEINSAVTLSSPGIYKIGSSFTTAGTAIIIDSDDVEIYNPDGYQITYADTEGGKGISITGTRSGWKIIDIDLQQGAFVPLVATDDIHGIHNNDSVVSGIIVNPTVHIPHGGTVSGANGDGIAFQNMRATSEVEIYGGTVTLVGGGRRYGIYAEGSPANFRIEDVTVNLEDCGTTFGYSRALALFGGKLRVHGNTVSLDADCSTSRGIPLWGGEDAIITDNTVTADGGVCQAMTIDGLSEDTIVMRNTLTSFDNSSYRERYGSRRTICTLNDSTSTGGSSGFFIGNTDASAPIDPGTGLPAVTKDSIFVKNIGTSVNGGYGLRCAEITIDMLYLDNTFSSDSATATIFIGAEDKYNVMAHEGMVEVGNSLSGPATDPIRCTGSDGSVSFAIDFSSPSTDVNVAIGIDNNTYDVDPEPYRPNKTPNSPSGLVER